MTRSSKETILSDMRLTTLLSYARVCLLFLTACNLGMAGGLYLIEVSTSETALAGAGWAARAQDPTTVVTNPAGMTELEGRQFQTMLQPLYLATEFDDDGSEYGDGRSADADGWTPTGSAFYTHQINDKWTAGVGLAGYFGLSLDYDDDWAGRYYVQEVTLQTIGLQPTVAYKINDQWSVGVGFAVLYGKYELEAATNPLGDGSTDGRLKFEDDDFSYQANIGVLYKLSERTRFGLQYFSESDQDFSDTPSFRNISPPINEIDINMTLPQSIILSGFHQLTDRLAIMGNVGWQEWSKFGEIGVKTTVGGSTTFNREYEDTWNVAGGVQYQLNEQWRLSTGLAYDTEMVKEENMTPDLPTGDSIRWGVGTAYQYSQAIELQFAYEIVYYGDLDLNQEGGGGDFNQGDISGTYPDNAIHFFSVGLNWKF